MSVLVGEVAERFLVNVDRSAGDKACWPWRGRCDPRGYGRFPYHGRDMLAHRLMYELLVGPLGAEKCVLHTCDNPPCCQVLHLFSGTHADNVRDMDAKGRRANNTWDHRGEKNPLSKMTDAQVISLRERYTTGDVTQKQLAAELGVTRSAVGAWISGRRSDTTSISRPPKDYATRGEGHYEGKLTADAVRVFRARAIAGDRLKDITDDYNATATVPVTKQMVWRIIHRKAWTHVE